MKLIISIIIDIMYNYAKSLIRKIICKNEYSSIKKKKIKKIILTPGQLVMFHGPYFILITIQAGTSTFFKVFCMTGPSTNWESNPYNHLASAGSPYRRLVRSVEATEGLFVTREPHSGPPRGNQKRKRQ